MESQDKSKDEDKFNSITIDVNETNKVLNKETSSDVKSFTRKSKYKKSSYIENRHLREKRRPTKFAIVQIDENENCLEPTIDLDPTTISQEIAKFTKIFTATTTQAN
ncbi:uncharacterized protein LOC107370161 [Tetranychus urticae]|uniref:Uncharacterized protein n=1 Tax=Tetranychus urticae TaxID=32264 RepID=T1L497_TETUR|nr:uncharacterized protein LOC107362639 [Tetranychus urticae]XP_015793629.1 uncharacterized protein LOC107370161 [Tetranychus urticae]